MQCPKCKAENREGRRFCASVARLKPRVSFLRFFKRARREVLCWLRTNREIGRHAVRCLVLGRLLMSWG
jgi:ribosomal protein L19E